MVKKYVCIPRSFLVLSVCSQGKTLCAPCIFAKISELIVSLQVRGLTVFRIADEAKSCKGIMKVRKKRVREKSIASFLTPNLSHEEGHFTFTSAIFA
jgi:hypothetical protein